MDDLSKKLKRTSFSDKKIILGEEEKWGVVEERTGLKWNNFCFIIALLISFIIKIIM